MESPALAQLQHWRVVPGFELSAESMELSRRSMRTAMVELQGAVDVGELEPPALDEQAVAAWTVPLSGLMAQQMANETGASFDEGRSTRMTEPCWTCGATAAPPDRGGPDDADAGP